MDKSTIHYKVTLKNFKTGVVVREYIRCYNNNVDTIVLKFLNGKTKTYQKNEWALVKTTMVFKCNN